MVKYAVGSKILFKAINWHRAVVFGVSRLKALMSLLTVFDSSAFGLKLLGVKITSSDAGGD